MCRCWFCPGCARSPSACRFLAPQPNLIIAGQTAPSPGILVSNAGITVKSHRVRIEHIAVRVGDDRAGPDPRSRDGISIQTSSAYAVYSSRLPGNSRIYLAGNDSRRLTNVPSTFLVSAPHADYKDTMSADTTYDYVLAQAGSRPWDRNSDDIRVISGVRNRSLRLRNSVGTWPLYPVNRRPVAIPSGVVDLTRVNAAIASYERSEGPPVVAAPMPTSVALPTAHPTVMPTVAAPSAPSPEPTREPSQSTQRRSYTVVKVSSLLDTGAGTLRECIEKPFPRVCVFEVSGRISLASNLIVEQPHLIVAGQTAPSPGILLTNAGLAVKSHHVRIEHLSVRSGDDISGPAPESRRSVSVRGSSAHDVVLRNLSISWAVDENVQTAGPIKNVVFESCIISEALHRSIHPKGPHSMGVLINEKARGVRFIGNLLAANHDQNIRWKSDTQGEMINNVIYGWGGTSSWSTTNISDPDGNNRATLLDAIGNVFLAGPQGLATAYAFYSTGTPRGTRVYLKDNMAARLTNIEARYRVARRIFKGATPLPAMNVVDYVLRSVGSRPWDRSLDDKRVVNGVTWETLRIRNRVRGWPTYARNMRRITVADALITEERLNQALPLFERQATAVQSPAF